MSLKITLGDDLDNMNENYLHIMNITSEVVMFLILLFLLFACIWQRKRTETIRALQLLIVMNLMLLACQITEWTLLLLGADQTKHSVPAFFELKKFTYALDYSLYYFVSFSFFNYVRVHIRGAQKEANVKRIKIEIWSKGLIAWGILITCLFALLINSSWFYYLNQSGKEMFHIPSYLLMYMIGTVGTISSVILLIKYRKIVGHSNFIVLIVYILTTLGLAAVDVANGTCITYVLSSFYTFILYVFVELRKEKELAEKEEQLARQEKQLTELNTQIMLSQMQPHFLYNTLSTISALCYMDGSMKAKNAIDKFAAYFRENLDAMGKERTIVFEKELEHIKTYLWFEQFRFEDALNVEYDIQISDFSIPSLSIQPLVENAIKHGIRKKKGGGTVLIQTRELSVEYQIIVSDDGVGYEVGIIPEDGRSHTGIENIKARLKLICDGTCEIESKIGQGTTVTVHIPKEMGEAE